MKENLGKNNTKILKQVQNDKRGCHPEFISGSNERRQPVQNNRFQFGRSMVEMLGVLAIIGVLSIGGLSAYQYALRRHRMSIIKDFISRLELGVYENCFFADTCQLSYATTQEQAEKNHRILCGSVGSDMCALDLQPNRYSRFIHLPDTYWAMSILNSQRTFYFYLTGTPVKICQDLVNIDWRLSYSKPYQMGIGSSANTFLFQEDGTLSDENRNSLTEACLSNSWFYIGFKRKDVP